MVDKIVNATALLVRTGPTEATAVGNLLTQAVAAGTPPEISTGHRLVESVIEIITHEPTNIDEWKAAKTSMRALPTE
ncbi:hypothetical protein [Halocatena marina]|uniref:Uncharacterized protein n=1 Tax=Halocatena marina TaxID=2934937 RepID=A0ABD5YJS2_9EURY|nr:hypothetical protein [Halocatena marina]